MLATEGQPALLRFHTRPQPWPIHEQRCRAPFLAFTQLKILGNLKKPMLI